jgi:hypothetical protein
VREEGEIEHPRNGRIAVAVEHFEQTPFSFVIRGWSFDPNNLDQENATWYTRCAEIQPDSGKLHCLYATDVKKGEKLDRRDGIGTFDFGFRQHPQEPPKQLSGYAIDSLEDYKIIYEKVVKIDAAYIEPRKAAEQAKSVLGIG